MKKKERRRLLLIRFRSRMYNAHQQYSQTLMFAIDQNRSVTLDEEKIFTRLTNRYKRAADAYQMLLREVEGIQYHWREVPSEAEVKPLALQDKHTAILNLFTQCPFVTKSMIKSRLGYPSFKVQELLPGLVNACFLYLAYSKYYPTTLTRDYLRKKGLLQRGANE